MKRASDRIMRGVGRDRFQEEVVQRFPLALNDHAVLEVAAPLGFCTEWCQAKKSRREPPNGDLNAFFGSGAPAATPTATPMAPPATASGRVTGRVGGGAIGIAPPARPVSSAVPHPARAPDGGAIVFPPGSIPEMSAATSFAAANGGGVSATSAVHHPAPAVSEGEHATSAHVPHPAPERPVVSTDGHSDVLHSVPADGRSDVPHPAPTGPETSANGGSDVPHCVICHEDMLVTQPRIALPCGHTFHEHCIVEWRVLCHKSDEECPMRCHLSMQAAVNPDDSGDVIPDDVNPSDDASTEGISESEINAAAEAVREALG